MRCLLPAALLVASVPALHAQLAEVYGTVNVLHATNVPTNLVGIPEDPAPNLTSNTTARFGVGGTFNFINIGIAKLGVDVRGSNHNVLGGLKFAVKPPLFPLKPYIQGSVGYLNIPQHSTDNKYAVAEVLAGIDTHLAPFLNYRIVEIGEGHAIISSNGSKPSFLTVNTGIVFHF